MVITGSYPQRGTVCRDINRADAALHAGAHATPMNSKALMPLAHPVTSHSAATSAYWIRTIAKHTAGTVRESSPILSPWYLRGQSAYPLAHGSAVCAAWLARRAPPGS